MHEASPTKQKVLISPVARTSLNPAATDFRAYLLRRLSSAIKEAACFKLFMHAYPCMHIRACMLFMHAHSCIRAYPFMHIRIRMHFHLCHVHAYSGMHIHACMHNCAFSETPRRPPSTEGPPLLS